MHARHSTPTWTRHTCPASPHIARGRGWAARLLDTTEYSICLIRDRTCTQARSELSPSVWSSHQHCVLRHRWEGIHTCSRAKTATSTTSLKADAQDQKCMWCLMLAARQDTHLLQSWSCLRKGALDGDGWEGTCLSAHVHVARHGLQSAQVCFWQVSAALAIGCTRGFSTRTPDAAQTQTSSG
jgi:hypothetical protein